MVRHQLKGGVDAVIGSVYVTLIDIDCISEIEAMEGLLQIPLLVKDGDSVFPNLRVAVIVITKLFFCHKEILQKATTSLICQSLKLSTIAFVLD